MLICIHLAIPQEFNDTRPKTLGEIWKGSPLAILWLTPQPWQQVCDALFKSSSPYHTHLGVKTAPLSGGLLW